MKVTSQKHLNIFVTVDTQPPPARSVKEPPPHRSHIVDADPDYFILMTKIFN